VVKPNNFDLVRLLAAMQVVLVHGHHHLKISHNATSEWIFGMLYYFPGVPVFFVISGMLVSASYERSKSLSGYCVNRALRIYPALWVCFLVAVGTVLWLAPQLFFNAPKSQLVAWIVAQISFLQFYNPDFLRPYGVGVLNGSLWTIPVELQFYVALPATYWFLRLKNQPLPTPSRSSNTRLLGLTLVLFLVAQMFYRLGSEHSEKVVFKLVGCSMVPHFWLFLAGVLLNRNLKKLMPLFEGKFIWWAAIHVGVSFLFQHLGVEGGYNKLVPITCISLAGMAVSFAFSWRTLSDRLLAGNDISYGVYIYHMVILNALVIMGLLGTYWSLALLVFLTSICAIFSWRVIEKPCLSFKKRFGGRKETKPNVSSS